MTYEYGTAEEVCERYPLTYMALMVQRSRNQSPGNLGVKMGRRIVWRFSDIDAWFDEQRDAQLAAE